MRKLGILSVLGLVLMLALTACGGGQSGPAPSATPDGASGSGGSGGEAQGGNAAVNCPRSGLENWLQRSSALTQEFTDTVNSSLAVPPNQIGAVVDRLASVRGALLIITVPDCAQAHFKLLDETTQRVITTLEDYGRGLPVNLVEFISQSNAAFDQIRAAETELNKLYESLPQ